MSKSTIIGLGLTVVVMIGLLLVPGLMLLRFNSSEAALNTVNGGVDQLKSENAGLRQQLGLPAAQPTELPDLTTAVEAVSGMRLLIFLDIFLVVVLAASDFVVIYFLIRQLNEEKKKRRDEARLIQKQAYQEGLTASFKALVTKTDVLSNMVIWLARYAKGTALIDDAATLIKQLFSYLNATPGLEPIGEVGTVTKFTPLEQQTYDPVSTGEPVTVVKPGWRLAGQLIDRPTVSKVKSQP